MAGSCTNFSCFGGIILSLVWVGDYLGFYQKPHRLIPKLMASSAGHEPARENHNGFRFAFCHFLSFRAGVWGVLVRPASPPPALSAGAGLGNRAAQKCGTRHAY